MSLSSLLQFWLTLIPISRHFFSILLPFLFPTHLTHWLIFVHQQMRKYDKQIISNTIRDGILSGLVKSRFWISCFVWFLLLLLIAMLLMLLFVVFCYFCFFCARWLCNRTNVRSNTLNQSQYRYLHVSGDAISSSCVCCCCFLMDSIP